MQRVELLRLGVFGMRRLLGVGLLGLELLGVFGLGLLRLLRLASLRLPRLPRLPRLFKLALRRLEPPGRLQQLLRLGRVLGL